MAEGDDHPRYSYDPADAAGRMNASGISQPPVVDQNRLLVIVTESDLLAKPIEGGASLSSTVAEFMFRKVDTIGASADAGQLRELFAKGRSALVVDDHHHLQGIVTKMDLVDFVTHSVDEKLVESHAHA